MSDHTDYYEDHCYECTGYGDDYYFDEESRMNVLVACEESQEVCKAFRAKGHEAYSCDILEPSGGAS